MLKEISIEIIRRCPNNCLHCSSYSGLYCDEIISLEKFLDIVNGAVDLGLKTVCFSGGEPFLHPDIIPMIDYVHSIGINSYVYTSGIVLNGYGENSSLPEDVLHAISSKVTKLIFNIEASNSNTYDLIMRTRNCFEIMKQSVLNANKYGIVTEAHFVPMKLNVSEVESTILLCEQLGISKISFLRLVLHGRAFDNGSQIALSNEETCALKNKLSEIKKTSTLNVRVGVPLSEEESKHECEAAKGKLNIKYDGFVYPCEVFKNDHVKMDKCVMPPENIHDNDIKSIYNNSSYLNTVRSYIKDFTCSKTCENCVGQFFIDSHIREDDKDGK